MYKPAKTLDQQVDYLNSKKRVQFNLIDEDEAKEILLRYNYINVISPFKYKFAKLDNQKNPIKIDHNHIYERDVEFKEYYDYFIEERKYYPVIVTNILDFEIHFKSILAYYILTTNSLIKVNDFKFFLESLKLRSLSSNYDKRKAHMFNQIDALIENIDKYADIYCFFDRITLGNALTIFILLENSLQNNILTDLKKYGMTFKTEKVPDFIKKIFCLVSIRNCVMHCNSLTILIRYYNTKTHDLRKNSDKKRYLNLIDMLKIEKTHE